MPESEFFLKLSALLVFCSSCHQQEKTNPLIKENQTVKYAEHFELQHEAHYTVLSLKGRRNPIDTTAVFILYKDEEPEINYRPKTFRIKVPCTNMVALSSIYASMYAELGAADNLSAIDNMDYVCNPLIVQNYRAGKLSEVGKGPEPDMEKILSLRPDILLMFGMGHPEAEVKAQLIQSRTAYAQVVDHLEKSPLARAEWLKFFAAFVDKEIVADSIFAEVERKYIHLRDSVKGIKYKPLVLTELKYGETWYVPGGNSFMSVLLQDAGANYPWSEVPQSGSLPLSFEEVYLKAGKADFWINLSMVRRKTEITEQDERYAAFDAYKSGQLYNNNKRVNEKNYSDYWESAMYHPERVLRDLVKIFHIKSDQEKDLYYYQKIN